MLDFLIVSTRSAKHDVIEIYPKFRISPTPKDLMIRGGDFYAVWDEEKHLWNNTEDKAIELIDRELDEYARSHEKDFDGKVRVLHLWDSDTLMIDKWHKFVQKQCRDHYHPLDEKLMFSGEEIKKEDYVTKTVKYPLKEGSIEAYEELISTLYDPEERNKLEWAIGSIVAGESVWIQKFLVLYGSAGTGKSTILNIIQDLFDGYYSVFDAKALGMNSNSFALEPFKANPLVAIQHDGDLSRIEDNTRLNSIVSHEEMTVNEKFKSAYTQRFHSFLFIGTNRPVKITEAKSGILRRLIDVSPSGRKVSQTKYKQLTHQIKFELGGIAYHCKQVYLQDPGAYDDYVPIAMLGASNDFYNFVLDSFDIFKKEDGISLKRAWEMYNTYVTDAKVAYPCSLRAFKEELKNYFKEFVERTNDKDGIRVRNYYKGFILNKFQISEPIDIPDDGSWLKFADTESLLDKVLADEQAQYASAEETPNYKWNNVKTTLKDLDTTRLHYVRPPLNHIVIDFDLKDETGEKSFELNRKAAEKWPKTYAELSKGGHGIHLHYIYEGDPTTLSPLYDENIEVKVFTGKSSLRRKVSRCTNLPISSIQSGLPTKGDKKKMDFDGIKNERHLRALIAKNLRKECMPATKPSVDLIYKTLEDAYNSKLQYDVTDMRPYIQSFAANSTNHADYCLKKVMKMHFKSEDIETYSFEVQNDISDDTLVFFDVEVFPNLFVVVFAVGDGPCIPLINPSPKDIENLLKFKLVGFNNRRYDNHILYARLLGYSNEQLYEVSQNIISDHKDAFFGNAYNLSYTDIYDFASAGNKMSLKKWEIKLGIHHQELGLPWDQPVPEELWDKVAEYCCNDVIATRATFNALQGDFKARLMLAAIAGMSPNDTTNTLTTRIIFGNDKHPELVYTDLATGKTSDPDYQRTDIQTAFPGYRHEGGANLYRGEDVGYGGYVYAEPGMYGRTITFDVASMHPSSIIAMNVFGKYTDHFKEILQARIAIKHKDFETAKKMMGGVLAPYLDDPDSAKAVANALKTAINSVYGLTSASFANPFRDPRNVNNIVALRGALFMVNLKHEVQDRGFTVAHVKTDSIKVVEPTPEICEFIVEYGKSYGYNFEIEHVFEKICLVNNSVYIAKLAEDDPEDPGKWTATGAQFAVPYVFKTLFSKEPLEFKDFCETKTVAKAEMYLDFNESLPDVSAIEALREKTLKKTPSADVSKLDADIAAGHNYRFVGRAGLFCPIKEGAGGGRLVKTANGIKFDSVTGTKDYRWMEAEVVESLGKQADIDQTYYQNLINSAIDDISNFGDFYMFAE